MSSRMRRKIEKALNKKLRGRAAELGTITGKVSGRQNYSYVLTPGSDLPIVVYNGRTAQKPGQQVWIGRDERRGRMTRVLDAHVVEGDVLSSINPDSGEHAPNHAYDGPDPVYIHSKQIVPLSVYPSSGVIVGVNPGDIQIGGGVVNVAATTIDLTSHQPASGIRWVLVRVNTNTGVLSVQDGSDVALPDFTYADMPEIAAGYWALAAIKLYGQTALSTSATEPDIFDLRFAALSQVQLTVEEIDGSPAVGNIKKIKVTNGTLTNDGDGVITLDLTGTNSGDSTTADTYANRPAAGAAGNLFLPTDGFTVERDSGAAWVPWGPTFPLTKPPAVSGLTWINQGTASAADVKGGLLITLPGATAGYDVRGLYQAAPSTPYSIDVGILPSLFPRDYRGVVFGWGESSSGKLHLVRFQWQSSDTVLHLSTYSSPTAFSSDYAAYSGFGQFVRGVLWLRIRDDGTNRETYYSVDGQNWCLLHSIGRTNFLTADQIVVGGYVEGNATDVNYINVISWLQS